MEYEIGSSTMEQLPSVASLWKKMISYYYLIEKNFTVAEDSEQRYLNYLRSIYSDNLTKIAVAGKNEFILGFMIGKILIRPSVIVKGYIGIIEDYWVNRLFLDKNTQSEIREKLFHFLKEWFRTKRVERIRLDVSTKLEGEKIYWEKFGFKSYKWVMYVSME